MLRRILVLLPLALLGFAAVSLADPVDLKLLGRPLATNCAGSDGGSNLCETTETSEQPILKNGTREAKSISEFASQDTNLESAEEVEARKKKKGYGRIWLVVGAIKASMLYMMIHAVAAIAGKALIVAKIALAIATAVALKKLDHHEKTSYEIIKHPHHSYAQTHSTSVDYDSHGFDGHSKRRKRSNKKKK